MPVVPFTSPQAQAAAAAPDPTFIAIAAREFVDAAKATPPTAKAPDGPRTDAE